MRRLVFSLLVCFTLVGSLSAMEDYPNIIEDVTSEMIVDNAPDDDVTCTMSVTVGGGFPYLGGSVTCSGSATAPTPDEACRLARATIDACLEENGF